jgi:hypothetical protein
VASTGKYDLLDYLQSRAGALADELDADFDPEKYDAKMAALFGEECV